MGRRRWLGKQSSQAGWPATEQPPQPAALTLHDGAHARDGSYCPQPRASSTDTNCCFRRSCSAAAAASKLAPPLRRLAERSAEGGQYPASWECGLREMLESLAADSPPLLVRRRGLAPPADAPCIASCGEQQAREQRGGGRWAGWQGAGVGAVASWQSYTVSRLQVAAAPWTGLSPGHAGDPSPALPRQMQAARKAQHSSTPESGPLWTAWRP